MENKNNCENRILDLTLEFSLLAIDYCELLEEKKRYVITNQLLKSATRSVQIFLKLKMRKAKQILYIR